MVTIAKAPRKPELEIVTLSQADVARRREKIIAKYGSRDKLIRQRNFTGLSFDERNALKDLNNLDYLAGQITNG
ncbi:hypothetical protein OZX73_00535 [Bifidobacterium sp. ESL0775]|uniref:hypothetical protein n=1 Tax=Bifidobacterium sp. ESL0775 TaxID=2983230 RepID=UPI0023FA0C88|nr:hypothetical protein [Bifidobacterium sp. ESL0775]WEV69421.1 hypothetical protein OZX73_00535 [Bifidobacterium sp. ESL0775]